MYPSIRSATTHNRYGLLQNLLQTILYHLLHPHTIGVSLPTFVVCAAIADMKEVAQGFASGIGDEVYLQDRDKGGLVFLIAQ
ncbi:hypothetical protein GCM10011323_05320 [Pontibacter amylolyticus]|uniref:Uncharacterized protein n=1 Tax=Pontibacter amylolyticus TaxID=1424080 RepID=A0ABQ1VZ87_9BACT|nr:hypothetical protein GCM10011323_05320 [Pontibacter amylolyticus]